MALTNIAPQNNPMGYNITGGTGQGFLANDLNLVIPEFKAQLVPKYGVERYCFIQELLGQTAVEDETSTRFIDHFEERRLMPHMVVAANTTTNTVVIVGTAYKTPARAGETVEIASTGVRAKIATVSADGLTLTLTKNKTTDNLFSVGASTLTATEVLLCRGNINAGEASDKMSGISPYIDRIRNSVTEVREDYTITDKAMMETIQVEGGKYYPIAQRNLNNKFLNYLDYVALEGCPADNLGFSVGTTGVIDRAKANGSNIQYTASSGMAFANFQEVTRALDFSGGAGEYHWLCDVNQRQTINDLIFNKMVGSGSSFYSTGSQENAIGYGFKSFGTDTYTFHMFKNKAFNPQSAYGAVVPLGSNRSNFGVLIPQKINVDPKTGKTFPSFQIVYQKRKGQKIYTFETGGMADSNKTAKLDLTLTQVADVAIRVFAANQFATVTGM